MRVVSWHLAQRRRDRASADRRRLHGQLERTERRRTLRKNAPVHAGRPARHSEPSAERRHTGLHAECQPVSSRESGTPKGYRPAQADSLPRRKTGAREMRESMFRTFALMAATAAVLAAQPNSEP